MSKDDEDTGAKGSRARANYAALLVETGLISKDNLILVFPQGASKADPFAKRSGFSLGKMMADYCRTLPEFANATILQQPMGWTTLNDVVNSFELVRRAGYERAHMIFVTDDVHIRRVKIVWRRFHPYGWSAKFYGARSHRMSWKERWIREPIARIVYRFKKPAQIAAEK